VRICLAVNCVAAIFCSPLVIIQHHQQTIAYGKAKSNTLFITALQPDGLRVALQLDLSTTPASVTKLSTGFLKGAAPLLDAAHAFDNDHQVQWFETLQNDGTTADAESCVL
jgi:hypothetical protein